MQKTLLNIKQIRDQKSITQSRMAERLNLSQSAYSKLELGKREITLNLLVKIGLIFNMSLSEIIEYPNRLTDNNCSCKECDMSKQNIRILLETIETKSNLINQLTNGK